MWGVQCTDCEVQRARHGGAALSSMCVCMCVCVCVCVCERERERERKRGLRENKV